VGSEFNWKTESCKIQRLEFISDKIEGGDSKREVICIHFGQPTKKNEIVWGSPWEAAMAGLEAPWELMGSSQERGRKGEWEEGQGARLGEREGYRRGGMWARTCCSVRAAVPLLMLLLLLAWEETGRRKKRREREKKRKGRKRKEKNIENFSNLKIFRDKNKS
jgi:hypothetical protein